MRHYTVAWAVTAQDDLEQIATSIAEDSAVNALRVVERIEHLARTLMTLPSRGRVVPELRWHGITTHRELIMKPWRLMYRIDGSVVFVISVLDGRRQLEDLLLNRLAQR